jgi:hypothetical protein
VPLFKHLRDKCTQTEARAALDRILRDEVRHRDFGWDLLDWLVTVMPDAPAWVAQQLPAMLGELEATYGRGNTAVSSDDGSMSAAERAWGLAPPRDYAEILGHTVEHDFRPRFAARDIALLQT